MYQALNISVPHTDNGNGAPATVEITTDSLPVNVRQRLIELGLANHIRSAVNSRRSTELEAAMKEAREKHDEAQKKAKAKDKDHKVVKFNEKAFREAFEFETDPMAVAAERVEALMNGEIRAARGASGANKLLAAAVRNNILTVLKAKGKAHKEALAMIGDDPFAFIDKTARKRAGEGDGADERYASELAKLNAQYVDPARALIAPDEPSEGDEEGEEGGEADDLI